MDRCIRCWALYVDIMVWYSIMRDIWVSLQIASSLSPCRSLSQLCQTVDNAFGYSCSEETLDRLSERRWATDPL